MAIEMILNFVLWLPFLIMMLIIGISFCVRGYKKGTLSALASFGATVVSLVVSVLVSGLLARLFTPLINKLISRVEFGENNFLVSIVSSLVGGIATAVVSLLVFSIVFLILTIAIKAVARILLKSRNEKKAASTVVENEENAVSTPGNNEKKKASKFGGMGIRALDALLFAFAILLPLYGSIASFAPGIKSVYGLSSDKSASGTQSGDEIAQILETVDNHVLTKVYKTPAASSVYSGITSKSFDSNTINLTELTKVGTELLKRIENFDGANRENADQMALEIIKYCEKHLIDKGILYPLYKEGYTFATDIINKAKIDGAMSSEEIQAIDGLIEILPSEREEFDENINNVVNYFRYLFENKVIAKVDDTNDFFKLGFGAKTAELLNSTDFAVAMKKLVLDNLFASNNQDEFENSSQFTEEFKDFAQTKRYTDSEQAQGELRAFITLIDGGSYIDAALYHPNVSNEKVIEYIQKANINDLGDFDVKLSNKETKLIKSKLVEFINNGLYKESPFSDCITAFYNLYTAKNIGEAAKTLENSEKALEMALATIDSKVFIYQAKKMENSCGSEIYKMLVCLTENRKSADNVFDGVDLEDSVDGLISIMNAAYDSKFPVDSNFNTKSGAYAQFSNILGTFLEADGSEKVVDMLIEKYGNNPFNLLSKLNSKQKESLKLFLEKVKTDDSDDVGFTYYVQTDDSSSAESCPILNGVTEIEYDNGTQTITNVQLGSNGNRFEAKKNNKKDYSAKCEAIMKLLGM